MVAEFISGMADALFSVLEYLIDVVFPAIGDKYLKIATAPYHFPDMIWIITPLVVALVLMEFYFGRYTKEELGWNTAVGNSLVLIFVSIDLMRHIFSLTYPELEIANPGVLFMNIAKLPIAEPVTFSIALFIGIIGIWILFFDFFHILPKRVAFKISASLPINVIAYLGIVLIYTDLLSDMSTFSLATTATAALLFFLSLLLLFGAIHIIEPEKREADD